MSKINFRHLGLAALTGAALALAGCATPFKADVARVSVGTEQKTVNVPDISIEKPADKTAPANK